MEISKLLSTVDHTLLSVDAVWPQVETVCADAVRYGCASVCIAPGFVAQAADYLHGQLPICTVIGFPNGYATTAAKCFETEDALKNGAQEIDMVIRVGWAKEGRYDQVLEEIRAVKAVCGSNILKVIVETCLLTREEKIALCQVVSDSGAEFIKTSTGFAGGGATREDVSLFAEHIAPHVKIKAAGGIATLADAEDFLRLGAARLGTSRIVREIKNRESSTMPHN